MSAFFWTGMGLWALFLIGVLVWHSQKRDEAVELESLERLYDAGNKAGRAVIFSLVLPAAVVFVEYTRFF